jgi:hypothetical protein
MGDDCGMALDTHPDSGPHPGESEKERVDRELMELLQELRVAIPGVQVLFAFLLTIPFSQGFSKLTGLEKNVFATSLLLSAAATALLIAPTSYHRLHFRAGNKERMLFTSNRLAIAGLLLLASAIATALFVALSAVFDVNVGVSVMVGAALWFGWFWYGVPLIFGRRED